MAPARRGHTPASSRNSSKGQREDFLLLSTATIRDFIHVADVARFVEIVLDRGVAGVYNVGTGRAVSIRELATIMMRLAGLSGEPLYAPPRPGDIKHSVADATKAKSLGWQPQILPEEGLRRLCTLNL
ncbi:MAG: GDP-mannose 4,6-dehydratase [Acidilobaceae archaeon]